ncbi:MAG: endonuclease/exonuclease/phosphatase family protein [Chitinophagaceae bacterium]
MVPLFRKLTKRFFITANIIAVLFFLIACLAAYCNPVTYWLVALLGVGFIFFTVIIILFFIFWLLFRSKWALLSLAALLLGWYQIHALFAFNPLSSFYELKQDNSFRVLTWNVSRWDEMNKQARGGASNRLKMFEFIKSQDADILCFQEFFESRRPDLFDENIPYITKQLNYPYHYFASDHMPWNGIYEHGVAIFSRFPIRDTSRIRYPGPDSLRSNESLIKVTIDVNGNNINIFTTHLQSFLFTGNDYRGLKTIKKADDTDSIVTASKGIISKFRRSYAFRSSQADLVREQLDNSKYPEIICGDFNDVPNSYTYFTIKGNRQDAFVKKGFGLGRTFVSISPTLRIDYMLPSKEFEVLQYKKVKLPYSDHFPLVSDFRILPKG